MTVLGIVKELRANTNRSLSWDEKRLLCDAVEDAHKLFEYIDDSLNEGTGSLIVRSDIWKWLEKYGDKK